MPGNIIIDILKGYVRDPLSDCVLMGVFIFPDESSAKGGHYGYY